MLRTFVCATLALLLSVGLSLAADKNNKKKKGVTVAGTVKSIDAATGKLTVTVKTKKMTEDKDFTLGDTVKVVTFNADAKSEATGKDGFKGIKTGDKIHVHSDDSGNVVSIQIGTAPKKKKANK